MPLKFAASTTAGQLLASMLVNLIPDVFGATAPDAVGWGAPPMDAAAVDVPAPRTSAGGRGAGGGGGRGQSPRAVWRAAGRPRGKTHPSRRRAFVSHSGPPGPPPSSPRPPRTSM